MVADTLAEMAMTSVKLIAAVWPAELTLMAGV